MMRRYKREIVLVIASLIVVTMLFSLIMTNTARAAEAALPAGLKAEVAHMVLLQDAKAFSVAQMVDIVNNSSEPSPEIRIPVPAGAANFTPMSGNPTLQGNTIVIAAGIAPKEKLQVGFKYTLPPSSTTELTFTDVPPADMSMLLIDEAALTLDPALVAGKGFNDLDLFAINQVAYRQFEVKRPAPGAPVTVKVNAGGNPAKAAEALAKEAKNPSSPGAGSDLKLLNGSFHGGNANVMLWQRMTGSSGHGGLVGISIIGLVVVGAVSLVVTVIRRHSQAMLARTRPAPAAPAEDEDLPDLVELLRQKKALARRIVEIDQEAARKPSGELTRQRAYAKQRLGQVIRQIRALEAEAQQAD